MATKAQKRPNGAGGVREYVLVDGARRWEIYFSEPDATGTLRRRFKKGFESHQSAKDELQAVQVHIREGTHQRLVKDSFGEYAEAYLSGLRVRATTQAAYLRHYRVHIHPALAERKIASITKNDLNRMYRDMERGGRKDTSGYGRPSSPATVRHIHALVKQILQSAVDDGLIRSNPASLASPPSASQARPPEIEAWDASQATYFLERSRDRNDYLHIAWLLLLGTGMRRGELVALRWRDVDLERGNLAIQRSYFYIKQKGMSPLKGFSTTKSGKSRVVDIDPQLVDALARHKAAQIDARGELGRDALVIANRFDEPLNPELLSQQFRGRVIASRVDRPNLPLIKLHGLRHTHATLLLSSGIHPKVVQERLGHSNIVITLNTYSHVLPTLQRGAATAIGSLLTLSEIT